ncbi:Diguanylate cyclase DosC [compost metagenome]
MQPLRHGEAAIALTASIGAAQRQPQEAPHALLHRADEAMYLAKHKGRNRIELAAGSPPTTDSTAAPALP